jgi:large subunit ribosomal protein L3
MAGQMGNVRTTVQGLKVVRVEGERNLLLLNGGVPGGDNAIVLVRQSVKSLRGKKAKKA